MNVTIILKLSILSIIIINCRGLVDNCIKLSNGCQFKVFFRQSNTRYRIMICNHLNKSFEISESEQKTCKKTATEIYFKLSSPEVLDRSINFTSINKFIFEMNPTTNSLISSTIKFLNLNGFGLNMSTDDSTLNYTIAYKFQLHEGRFQFFFNNQPQVSCEDFFKSIYPNQSRYFKSHQN